jgi:hypothetical protein
MEMNMNMKAKEFIPASEMQYDGIKEFVPMQSQDPSNVQGHRPRFEDF